MTSSTLTSSSQLTLAEFLALPETKPAREYIDGKIYQKPMPQGEHSILQTRLSQAINQVGESQQLALALTELRSTFGGQAIVPDVSVFEWQRIPRKANGRIDNKFTIPPDWVIEILSPEQSPSRVISEITFCLQQGTKLGWFIEPEDESVMVLLPNQLPDVKYGKEKLPVLGVFADLQLTVADVFSWLQL
ncbi:MAG: Uma2 family endonuclease [Symploca sp. SIO2E6]|nr:Uma2 family endonuclease [Symploca sp. SIO2E6]